MSSEPAQLKSEEIMEQKALPSFSVLVVVL